MPHAFPTRASCRQALLFILSYSHSDDINTDEYHHLQVEEQKC